MEEVTGSKPVSPTNFKHLNTAFFYDPKIATKLLPFGLITKCRK